MALVALGLAGAAALSAIAWDGAKFVTVVFRTPSGDVSVRAEVARSPHARSRGLMFREHLANDTGMLFVFARETRHPFWMKNTTLPLDMIFLRSDLSVAAVVERSPLSLESTDGGVQSRYVVEVARGWSRAHRITVGTQVTIEE